MSESLQIGDIVRAPYKTGVYIGEITNVRPEHYLVKVKAVLKHPAQGDLHNPKQVGMGFFHERKALAEHEQTNILKGMVKPYEGEIPNYKISLTDSLRKLRCDLDSEQSEWATLCLEKVETLEKEYKL
ncbi:kinase-associated lipoprotein B [Bacillus suaedaesalsae]|uniref:Kinase-associated lipoprotein B n=1 Tax=Bacillus suaedaesalsae TaxID=2810349 RepID=A0ABS2DJV4_9BACI|nr:kinase-associated lipoprotein B [Bacillus suaedaesalsae]MBM6618723.1 kinase-associated lipoprotein B [Bacillus suaedaesalsae]